MTASPSWTPPGVPPKQRSYLAVPFNHSRAKLDRALQLIEQLRVELVRYQDSHPWLSGSASIMETGFSPGDMPKPPLQAAAIIGDVLHNLRSALDVMACEAVRLYNGDDSAVSFPFFNSVEHLDDKIGTKPFAQAGPAALQLIRDLQPYDGGDPLLVGLQHLNNQDKHRMIVVHSHKVSTTHDLFQMPSGQIVRGPRRSLEITYDFPNDGALAGEPVLDRLEEMHGRCAEIVEAFFQLLASDPWFPEWYFAVTE